MGMTQVERRYQVFVSSTFQDLGDERQEVMQALLELDCIPAGMELFPAANDDQWTLIKRVIDDCDYYLVIVGGRYGSIAPSGKSYTQMEYEYAVAQGKPVMAFLHKDPTAIPVKKSETTAEGKEKLAAFREVAQQRMCKFWTTSTELGSVVSRSLIKLIRSAPAVGWVRGDQVPEGGSAEEILRLRNRIDELLRERDSAVASPPAGTSDLAQGDDEVDLNFSFDHKPPNTYSNRTSRWVFSSDWNSVFACIAPLMIDKASDSSLRKALNQFVDEEVRERAMAHKDLKGHTISGFRIGDDDFLAIKVQLRALGLIGKVNVSKRGVHDKDTYWTLTPYGDAVMTQLRAAKRSTDNGK
jgi:hypothetical protein